MMMIERVQGWFGRLTLSEPLVDTLRKYALPLAAFLAVVVIGAFGLVALISRTNATMCSLNWEALGTWAGTLVLAASAVVALRQLHSINDNERIRNTLSLMTQYRQDKIADALGWVSSPVMQVLLPSESIPDRNLRYYVGLEQTYAITKSTQTKDQLAEIADRYTKIFNYFNEVFSLWERGRIDEALYIRQLGAVICVADEACKRIFEDVFKNADSGVVTLALVSREKYRLTSSMTGYKNVP